MPTLSDLLDAGAQWGRNTQARLSDLVSNPAAYLTNAIREAVPPVRNQPISAGLSREDFDRWLNLAGIGWTAYHGSPHKFDKFSMDKIGTGEGAQAYGHGLYFADNPSVAIDYKAALSRNTPDRVKYDGNVIRGDTAYSRAVEDMALLGKPAVLQKIDDNIRFNEKYAPDMANMYRDLRKQVEALDPTKAQINQGSLYKVDIDDARAPKEAFLQWDLPLSQQSESVQKAVRGLVGEQQWKNIATPSSAPAFREWTGGDFMQRMGGINQDQMSAKLREAGIPGIRYLDAGSRANGGTYNTVLFDDSLVKILGRE